jgi:hypothetical protein
VIFSYRGILNMFCLCTMHSILGEPCDFFLQGIFEYVLGLILPLCVLCTLFFENPVIFSYRGILDMFWVCLGRHKGFGFI